MRPRSSRRPKLIYSQIVALAERSLLFVTAAENKKEILALFREVSRQSKDPGVDFLRFHLPDAAHRESGLSWLRTEIDFAPILPALHLKERNILDRHFFPQAHVKDRRSGFDPRLRGGARQGAEHVP